MTIVSFQWNVGDDEEEVTVNVTSYTPGTPGKYHGPWEDSYPDEPAECEYEVLRADGSEYKNLSESEVETLDREALMHADEAHAEGDCDGPEPDYFNFDKESDYAY